MYSAFESVMIRDFVAFHSARKAVSLVVKGINQGGAHTILLVLTLRGFLIPWLKLATPT